MEPLASIPECPDDNTCAICLDQMLDAVGLDCAHSFCRLCLEGLKGCPNVTCPVCRRPAVLRWLLSAEENAKAEEQRGDRKKQPLTFVAHTLEPYDTFPALCVRYNTTVDAIRLHNHLMVPHLDLLAPGTVLMIPVDEPPRPQRAAADVSNEEEVLEKLRQKRMVEFMAVTYMVPRDEAAVYLRSHNWVLDAAVAEWRSDVAWEEQQIQQLRDANGHSNGHGHGHGHGGHHICVERPRWVENKAHRGCMLCKKHFGVLRWRHHCRHCGKLVCDACSGTAASLPQMGYFDPVRICQTCTPVRG